MAKLSKNQQKHIRRTTPTLASAPSKRGNPKASKSGATEATKENKTTTSSQELKAIDLKSAPELKAIDLKSSPELKAIEHKSSPELRALEHHTPEKLSALAEGKLLKQEQPVAEATEVVPDKKHEGRNGVASEVELPAEAEAPPKISSDPFLKTANGAHTNGASKVELKAPKVLQPMQPASTPKIFLRGRPGVSTEKAEKAAAPVVEAPEASPQAPPLPSFWGHPTTRTLLWFVAFVGVAALWGKGGGLDLTKDFVHKNMAAHAPTSEEANNAAVAANPFSPFNSGGGPALPAVEEEPPLPPPARPGENKTPFNGQAIEESCLKKEGERCVTFSLDPFYEALAKTLRKEPDSTVRVTHFGDSIIAADYISSRVREQLQNTFGDAGSGYLYLGKPSRWYYREGAKHEASNYWDVRTITSEKKADDHLYGLGGASFEAQGPGIDSTFATSESKTHNFGKSVSRFDVFYLSQPGGGDLILSVDGKEHQRVSTKSPEKKSGFVSISVPDGAHSLNVKSAAGKVRGFGVVLEREAPGVVYDSLGLVSGSAKALLQIDAAHWQEQLKQRNPTLVIFTFGTNEVGYSSVSSKWAKEYEEKYKTILTQVRQALPDAACLVMAPPDSDTKKDGAMVTWPALPLAVEAQRNAAKASGCAYWDTYNWMGGKNSMATWVKKGLAQNDYAHPTKKGAAKIGDAFFEALMAGYDAYVARNQSPPK